MIYNETSSVIVRDQIIQKCKANHYESIIDVGGSLGFWCREISTDYADLIPPVAEERHKPYSIVDIANPLTWDGILEYVDNHGKFEYAICTQTLEHTTNIRCAIQFLTRIAKQGFVGIPNKFVELSFDVAFGDEGPRRCNLSGKFRGFLPHRWIFTIKEGRLWAFPKLPFINVMRLSWVYNRFHSEELSFEWSDDIPFFEVSDIILDEPDPQKAIEYYYEHLKGGI